MTKRVNPTDGQSLANKEPVEGNRETVEKNLERAERGGQQGGYHLENQKGAADATADNDLTTGHSTPGDGGADNAKGDEP